MSDRPALNPAQIDALCAWVDWIEQRQTEREALAKQAIEKGSTAETVEPSKPAANSMSILPQEAQPCQMSELASQS